MCVGRVRICLCVCAFVYTDVIEHVCAEHGVMVQQFLIHCMLRESFQSLAFC